MRDLIVKTITMFSDMHNKPLSDLLLEAYVTALSDMTETDFKAAVNRCIRECKFMPTPADIRSGYMPTMDPDTPAYIAWSKVIFAITNRQDEKGHNNGAVCFDDPVIHQVLGQLEESWDDIRQCDDSSRLKWIKKEFLKVYNIVRLEPDKFPMEKQIGHRGFPMFIGDRVKCEKLFKNEVPNVK